MAETTSDSTPTPPDASFVDNTADSRYELHHGGQLVSLADYGRDGPVVTIPHVETDPARRGNGHAAELLRNVLDHLRDNDLRLRPLCPFAAAYMRDHPDQQDLLAH